MQLDSSWNGFIYVCDGEGSVAGTAASKEQVRLSLLSLSLLPMMTQLPNVLVIQPYHRMAES